MAEFTLGPEFERYQRDMQEQMGDFSKMQESIRPPSGAARPPTGASSPSTRRRAA